MVQKSELSQLDPYRIDIVGRHVLVTDAMKNYAIQKFSKIERFHPGILDMHVTMDIQKLDHSVVLVIRYDHLKIKVHSDSNDMYTSIDRVATKLSRQITRWKRRLQEHHGKHLSVVDMQVNVLQRPYDELEDFNEDIEAAKDKVEDMKPPKVIATTTRALKTLTQDEALMKLELSGDGFLIYRDEISRKLKIMYRRKDGNYALVQPE